jgi:hypothetical protein
MQLARFRRRARARYPGQARDAPFEGGVRVKCPKCGFEQPADRPDCARCGVIFAALRRPTARAAAPPRAGGRAEATSAGPPGLDVEGRRALAIGGAVAAVLLAVPFLRFVFTPLLVIVHELGHTAASWVFGYPAVPAFDFVYGGGWSLRGGRSAGLLVLVVLAFAGPCWLYRRNRRTLAVLAALLGAWALLAATAWHQTLVGAAGHGTELLVAGIFLYRGLSGQAVRHSLERPLYVAFGAYLLLQVAAFAGRLATGAGARAEYEQGKGGVLNDLHDIALDLHLGLGLQLGTAGVAAILLACCALPPAGAWWWHRHRAAIHDCLARLLEREPA